MKYYTIEVSAEGRWAFIPAERGRYIRTHPAALFVACPNAKCEAPKKKPCISIAKLDAGLKVYQAPLHPERRALYVDQMNDLRDVDDAGKAIPLRFVRKRG